jgi:hypothetical protein
VGASVGAAVGSSVGSRVGSSVGFSSPMSTAEALGDGATMFRRTVAPNATPDTTKIAAMAKGSAAGRRRCEVPRIGVSGRTKSSSTLPPVGDDR